MSILQLIELTRRSFEATTAAMNVVGQNIANEQTEGYKRRRIELRATSTNGPGVFIPSPLGVSHGSGVSLDSIERIHDSLLASSAWEARSGLGAADEEARLLSAIENLFPSNNAGSLNNVLSDFWGAWNELSTDPSDLGIRQTLLNRTSTLTDTLNRISSDLDQLRAQTIPDIESAVEEFNTIIDRIAELNGYIQAQRASGTPDFAAEDERDLLITDLAELAPVQVQQDEGGIYNVYVRGMVVVQGKESNPLELDTAVNPPSLNYANTTVPFSAPAGDDGRIGALLRTLNTTIPEIEQQLDSLASTLVTRVNAIHNTGYGLDGTTGRDFFDATGTTADTIQLSADVSDSRFIAASDNPDATATEDNDIALAILNERTAEQGALNDSSIEDYAISIVSGVGSQLETVTGQFEGHAAVVTYLDSLERGVSGVSINEELSRLIQYQQSFSASARVLNTAQVMLDTILAL